MYPTSLAKWKTKAKPRMSARIQSAKYTQVARDESYPVVAMDVMACDDAYCKILMRLMLLHLVWGQISTSKIRGFRLCGFRKGSRRIREPSIAVGM